jgi:hypothetical protein
MEIIINGTHIITPFANHFAISAQRIRVTIRCEEHIISLNVS